MYSSFPWNPAQVTTILRSNVPDAIRQVLSYISTIDSSTPQGHQAVEDLRNNSDAVRALTEVANQPPYKNPAIGALAVLNGWDQATVQSMLGTSVAAGQQPAAQLMPGTPVQPVTLGAPLMPGTPVQPVTLGAPLMPGTPVQPVPLPPLRPAAPAGGAGAAGPFAAAGLPAAAQLMPGTPVAPLMPGMPLAPLAPRRPAAAGGTEVRDNKGNLVSFEI